MRSEVEQRVLDFVRQSRMASAGDRVGVAVSGGADSVAMLRLLESLRDELGITLLVVHFDHMLRGAESESDARFVAGLAQARGLEFVDAREDVRAAAAKHGWNIEEAARRLRYAFFDRILGEGTATRIAVAHSADDQAETLLGHVVRGTGLTGLAGIYPIVESSAGGAIIRPLLHMRRQELRDYLETQGQEWREDPTNRDETRLRARIRARLLPVLESEFSPQIVERLGELARLAREEEMFWSALVEAKLAECAEVIRGAASGTAMAVDARALIAPFSSGRISEPCAGDAMKALTERLIRRLYEKVRGDRRELSACHVEQVIRLAAESTSGKRVQLPGRIAVERVFGRVVFSCAQNQDHASPGEAGPSGYQYVVKFPDAGTTSVAVPELATCFRLKIVDWPLAESDTKSDSDVLDAGVLRAPLLLRNWRAGDAYRPRGHRQTRKLKQMFLAERIPSHQRARWPVLESAGQVVWARGMAPAAEFCARKGTRVGVLIEEESL